MRLAVVNDMDGVQENKPQADFMAAKIKDFRKRSKKVASLITHTIDDTTVMILDVHGRNLVLMWIELGEDYINVTLAQKSAKRKEFLDFEISEKETYVENQTKIQQVD